MGRKVFLDDLPRRNKDKRKRSISNKIDWKESIGYKIKFQYDDIEGEIEIVDYKPNGQYLYIKYLDKEPFEIRTGNFSKGQLGILLDTYTGNFKIKIGQTLKDNNRDITIINRKYKKDNKGQNRKYYQYKCNKCGFECGEHYRNGEYQKDLWIEEASLLRENGIGCACCSPNHKAVVPEINSIVAKEETHWMIKYFQNPEDAKKYTPKSNQKIYPICPDCGRIKTKSLNISNINKHHSIGCVCSDGQSYPFKFMFSVLEQLGIEFETEFSPDWIKPKRYDFYFELNNNKYIVEMDGELGHGNTDNLMNGMKKEESKAIDDYKDILANEHGIEVVRIDSTISELEYIKNNILNSKLNELLDLNKINWKQVEEFSLSNLVKKACELKHNNPDFTTTEIGKIMKVHYTTIIRYLHKGEKLGWCKYIAKRKNEKNNNKLVVVFKDGIKLGEFESCADLERQSEEKFGIKLFRSNISLVCRGKQKSHRGFTFKYVEIVS